MTVQRFAGMGRGVQSRPPNVAGPRLALLALLLVLSMVSSNCWLWEQPVSPNQTPTPTATPAWQQTAARNSPSIGGRLLYAAADNIWLRTGTNAQRLTEATTGTQPAWSPDGMRIAFVVRGDDYSDIWVMNADGSNPHPVTNNRAAAPAGSREAAHESCWAAQPQWNSPEGALISYVFHPPTSNLSSILQVWTMIADDGSEQKPWLQLSQNIESPVWSPDGQTLVFTLYLPELGAQLRYMDADRNVHRLGKDAKDIQRYDPTWSPDGLWIAYAARQVSVGTTDLWLMPSPLNPLYQGDWTPTRLTQLGAARGPAWSPDGKQIAFVAAQNGAFNLWLLTLDTSGAAPRPVADPEQLTIGGDVDATARPSWAP